MVQFIQAATIAITLIQVASALTCQRKADGAATFLENGKIVEPKPFDCLAVTRSTTTKSVVYLSDNEDGTKICQINDDGVLKDWKLYSPSEVPTGIQCRYVCRDSSNLYRCSTKTKAADNACSCEAMPDRVHVEKVSTGISGQSEEVSNDDESCEDKPEGFQFGDPKPCSSVQVDVFKRRVHFTDPPGMCRIREESQPETRYTLNSGDDFSLQACLYVCKRSAPSCIGDETGSTCRCRSSKLVKRLVPLDGVVVRDVLMATDCNKREGDKCGPCATCNKGTGNCDLHRTPPGKALCECGEICPTKESRSVSSRTTKVMCRANLALNCMKKPTWMSSKFSRSSEPGTQYPNLCVKGTVDSMDTCTCQSGYVEKPGPFSAVFCRKL